MKRWLPLLLFLAVTPLALPAQERVVSTSRLSITPFIAARAPLTVDRRATVVVPGGPLSYPAVVTFGADRAVGGIAGLEADLRLFGPVGVSAAVMHSSADNLVITTEREGIVSQLAASGPTVTFARGALQVRLPEPVVGGAERWVSQAYPAGWISVGAAKVWERYDGLLAVPGEEEVESWAAYLGYQAFFPLGSDHTGLELAIEDYVTFWTADDREARRLERALDVAPGTLLTTDLDYDRSHVWVARLGVSFRL